MNKKILLTGALGFVGGYTLRKLVENRDFEIVAIIRPKTKKKRVEEFIGKVEFVEIDLCDTEGLTRYLKTQVFDSILHIGAIRGGRKFSKNEYYLANVVSTKVLAENALKNNSKFIFCSSVGVFGSIPKKVPASKNTAYCPDNLYHCTKFEAEQMIKNLNCKRFKSYILRPSIIYGRGDSGFPNILIRLIAKKFLFFPKKSKLLHLTNINLLVESFVSIITKEISSPLDDIVVDDKPTNLKELADFINFQLNKKAYPNIFQLPIPVFQLAKYLLKIFHLNSFISKIDYLLNDWHYSTEFKKILQIEKNYCTIPLISDVVDEYKTMQGV